MKVINKTIKESKKKRKKKKRKKRRRLKREINDGSERKTKSIRWKIKGNDTIGA